jgi:outer membrane protein assembly factor BamB
VDVLDFPLSPPHGENARGGQDFGRFRDRFGKYHAGEDWRNGERWSSFGEPVYSIGHGLVTYAEPEGWNRDKGVVIIQHRFGNGRTVLSFYGHLDPPSVVLEAGDCVARGDRVGAIGRPRSSPHLHFEIRTQSPYAPLTGYWPDDPTLVGWLPPSAFIWEQRLAAAPGVQWVRPFTADSVKGIGVVNGDTLLAIEEGQLVGIDVADGRRRWQHTGDEDSGDFVEGTLDARRPVVYVADGTGRIEAFSLLNAQDEATGMPTLTSLWQVDLDVVAGVPTLLPLAEGGLALSVRQWLFAIDADGRLQWARRSVGRFLDWAATEEYVFLSTAGGDASLWQIDATGPRAWQAPVGGRPVAAGGQVWLVGQDGLYRLDQATKTAVLHLPFPSGTLALGDAVALPDGGLLVAHADPFDRRLMSFDGDGWLRWQGSYADGVAGRVQLLVQGGEVYVVAEEVGTPTGALSIYALDRDGAGLRRIFSGGTRSPRTAETWALATGERLLVNIGGGHMLALDARQALAAVAAVSE